VVQKNRLAVVDAITRGVVDVGELRISRTTLGKRGGERYLIYLPLNRNYLWRELYERRVRVRVFIEIPEVVSKSSGEG
jgi:hypothetical protein